MWCADALCEKDFDYKFKEIYHGYEIYGGDHDWSTSTIREWLTSDEIDNGFFSSENFSNSEKNVVKTVTIKNVVDNLPYDEKDYVQDYFPESSVADENLQEEFSSYPTEEFTESIFLLDYLQLTEIEKNKEILYTDDDLVQIMRFWLRTPFIGVRWGAGGTPFDLNDVFFGYIRTDKENNSKSFMISSSGADGSEQIRPAFYLNDDAAHIISGSGTEFDPYLIDGRAAPERFEENGLYGYKDANGNIVIEAKYEKALNFSDGAALVVQPGEDDWSYIDYDGNLIFEKRFHASNKFHNGYAVIWVNEEQKYAYIKKNGEIAYDMLFEDVMDFKDGFAKVKLDGKWGAVDRCFSLVIPFEYDDKDDMDIEKAVSELKAAGKYPSPYTQPKPFEFADPKRIQAADIRMDGIWDFKGSPALTSDGSFDENSVCDIRCYENLVYTYKEPVDVGSVSITFDYHYGISDFDLEYTEDGSEWIKVDSKTEADKSYVWKFDVNKTVSALRIKSRHYRYLGVVEFEVYKPEK